MANHELSVNLMTSVCKSRNITQSQNKTRVTRQGDILDAYSDRSNQ